MEEYVEGTIPEGRAERAAFFKGQFFHKDYEGIQVSDRIISMSKALDISITSLWQRYSKDGWKERYEREMSVYAQKREKQVAESVIATVVHTRQNDKLTDAISNTFDSAVKISQSYLNLKLKKQTWLMEEIETLLTLKGGFRGLSIEDKLLIKNMEKEIDNDISSMKGFILPEKLVHYIENEIALQRIDGKAGGPLQRGYTYKDLLNLVLVDTEYSIPKPGEVVQNILQEAPDELPNVNAQKVKKD
jgi:hypothetical protein